MCNKYYLNTYFCTLHLLDNTTVNNVALMVTFLQTIFHNIGLRVGMFIILTHSTCLTPWSISYLIKTAT